MMDNYLLHLTARLTAGLSRLPQKLLARHADYLAACQNPDGGFSGREGESDLYYTAFALRGLVVLDALTARVYERAAGYLRTCLQRQASVVDFYSLLYACAIVQAVGGPDMLAESSPGWPQRVADTLETFRKPDGGYAKATDAASGSTYHTFLVALCYELLGKPVPRPEEVVRFVLSRRRDDGGFVEVGPMRRSGTNPTAAAVGTLQLLGSDLPDEVREGVAEFLAEMPSVEGGLRANGRIPLADLLSTFTGCWTLAQLGALDRVDTEAAFRFAQSLEQPGGGFHAGLWDERADAEYTFYGLGTLALLTP
jgi:geranylgeranyl transferase type-2 subunit beta